MKTFILSLLASVTGLAFVLSPSRAADPAPAADSPEMRDLLAQLSRLSGAAARNEQTPAESMAQLTQLLNSLPQGAGGKSGQTSEILSPLMEMLKMMSRLTEDESPTPNTSAASPTTNAPASSSSTQATAPTRPPLGSSSSLSTGTLKMGRPQGASLAPAGPGGRGGRSGPGPLSGTPRLSNEEWRQLFPIQ